MTTERLRSDESTVPEVPGILTSTEVLATAQAIADVQRADGMIPWFEGGHCDPWNHVEGAMALSVCGLVREARAAYRWLAERQLPDGSWSVSYTHLSLNSAEPSICSMGRTSMPGWCMGTRR